jgi:hypothetical protein
VDRYLDSADTFLSGHPLAMLAAASQLPKFLVDDPAQLQARRVARGMKEGAA